MDVFGGAVKLVTECMVSRRSCDSECAVTLTSKSVWCQGGAVTVSERSHLDQSVVDRRC